MKATGLAMDPSLNPIEVEQKPAESPLNPLTPKEVKRSLHRLGTNLKKWCEEHGYDYRTVLSAVDRHVGKHDYESRGCWGVQTRKALIELGETIGRQLIDL